MRYFKHQSAYVDDGAEIGDDTRIWHFCHVAAGARIGRGCVLGQNVYVAPTAVLGDGVRVQNNVSIYDGVVLEDHVFVGPERGVHQCHKPPLRGHPQARVPAHPCRLRGDPGANSTVVCGHDIGRYAFIGAGAVVTKSVADFQLWLGVPAQLAGWVCRCGERLTPDVGEAGTRCTACGAGYRIEGDLLCAE